MLLPPPHHTSTQDWTEQPLCTSLQNIHSETRTSKPTSDLKTTSTHDSWCLKRNLENMITRSGTIHTFYGLMGTILSVMWKKYLDSSMVANEENRSNGLIKLNSSTKQTDCYPESMHMFTYITVV